MREILFKGFHANESGNETIYINDENIKGNWVFGYFGKRERTTTSPHTPNMTYKIYYIIVENEFEDGGTYFEDVEVIPKTISQFTGLLDKNGNKIFENDILEFENIAIYKVVFEDAMFKIANETDMYTLADNGDYAFCEIIGNKFDNADLLED